MIEIPGCCRECAVTWPIKDGPAVVKLCSLHAATQNLRDALREVVNAPRPMLITEGLIDALDVARAALRKADGRWAQ